MIIFRAHKKEQEGAYLQKKGTPQRNAPNCSNIKAIAMIGQRYSNYLSFPVSM